MIYLFDKAKTLLAAIDPRDITEHQQEITLNGLITAAVSFQYTPEVEQAQFFGAKDIDDEGIFWMYKIDRLAKTDGMALLDGTYVLFDDLAGRGIMKDRRPNNEGAATVLADILEGTGWQVGTVNTTHTGTSNYYYVSKLTAFWDFLKKWRVEFKPRITMTGSTITGRYIDIADQLSQDYGKWYEYGSNLLTVTAERAAVPYTAFIGRGKGEEVGDGYGRRITFEGIEWTTPTDPVNKPLDQAWVEVPEATAAYGYEDGSPRIGIVEFPEIADPAELLQATYDYAMEMARPAVQFSSSVVETGKAEVGETVTVLRDDIGIRYKTRIFKYKRNFLTGKVRTVEFGDQIQATTAQRAAEVTSETKAKEVETLSLLQTLRNAITAAYFNEDGYNYDLAAGNVYGLPGGYYSFDAPIDQAPTQAIYMGAGKLLISNSKDVTGQWIWQTAADGNGIVADAITTGILNAERIKAGILKGGKVNWNLETGELYIGESLETAALLWDGTSLSISFETGITRVGGDGVTVGIDGSTIVSRQSNDGFRVLDGAKELTAITEAGAVIPELQSPDIIGNVLNTISGGTYTVGDGKQYTTVTEAINDLSDNGRRRHLAKGATLKFDLYGEISDSIMLYDWSGGTIDINFTAGARLSGRIYAWFCNSRILIHGADGANGAIKCSGLSIPLIWGYGTKFLYAYYMDFDKGAGATVYGFRIEYGGVGLVENCDLGNVSYGAMSYSGSIVTAINNKGTCGIYGLYLSDGTLNARGTVPKGATGDVSNGGFYHTVGTLTPTDSAYYPPLVIPTEFTGIFRPARLWTYIHGTTTTATTYGATAAQGKWSGMSIYVDGMMSFGSDIYDYWQGGSNVLIEMRLRRQNSTHGQSAGVAPDPDNFTPSESFNAVARGVWTDWTTVPSSVFPSGGTTLRFYSPTLNTGYAIWDACEVRVKVTKEV